MGENEEMKRTFKEANGKLINGVPYIDGHPVEYKVSRKRMPDGGWAAVGGWVRKG